MNEMVLDWPRMSCSCVDLGVEDASRLAPPSVRTGEKKQTTAGTHNRRKPNNSMLTVSLIIKVPSEHFPEFRCGPDRRVHPHTHTRKPCPKEEFKQLFKPLLNIHRKSLLLSFVIPQLLSSLCILFFSDFLTLIYLAHAWKVTAAGTRATSIIS